MTRLKTTSSSFPANHLRFAALSLLALVFAGCGGGGSGGTTSPPPPPPQRTAETMVYVAGDGISSNGETELYAIQDDGSNRRLLSAASTSPNADIRSFKISPDGNWVAYLSDPVAGFNNRDSLFVVPVSGDSAPLRISHNISDSVNQSVKSFDWSPDSGQLVFDGNFDQANTPGSFFVNEVFVVNRDGSGLKKINGAVGSPALVEVRNPQWSPDGRYIVQEVFDWFNGSGSAVASALNIHDTTVTTPNSRRLVTGRSIVRKVRWSPDGSRLSFTSDLTTQGQYRVYVYSVDGLTRTQVSDNGDFNSDSGWAPDASRVAYRDHPTISFPSDLVVSAGTPGAEDTVVAFVSPNGRNVRNYAWSPDSRRIAYVADVESDNKYELFVANADGSGNATKVSGELLVTSDVFDIAWSPDGSRLAYLADQNTDAYIDLYVSNANGGGNTHVSAGLNAEEVTNFAWSRDSQRIAFSTGPEGRNPSANKLHIVQPTGSGRVELTQALANGPVAFAYIGESRN